MNKKNTWNTYRTRFLVRARQLTQPLIFTDSLGREHSGEPGDYLVETSDGIRRITSRFLFEDIYVPLNPQSLVSAGGVEKAPATREVRRAVTHITPDERLRATA
ncbi:MAG: hypothetical protein WBS24_04430 [Terriglobales bacterium]